MIAEAPIRRADAQLAVGQQLLGLARSVADVEQSRFNTARSGLQFQLQRLQEIGAGEDAIAAKKIEIDRIDRAALAARFQALQQQQTLERAILAINQEKARAEADVAVLTQRAELKKAEAELDKAKKTRDKFATDAAQAQVNLQTELLSIQQSKGAILQRTQPLEVAIAAAQGEGARSALKNEAAAKGLNIAADGTITRLSRINELEKARKNQANELASVYRQFQVAVLRPQADAMAVQVGLGQQLLNLSKSLGDVEQSRFGVVRSRLEYELQALQSRGAGESELAAKKAQIDAVDRQALSARYAALLQQQQLEAAILRINQQKAGLDAQIEIIQQRGKVLQAEISLQQALESGNQVRIAQALLQLNQEKSLLGVQQSKINLLAKVQPIETAIAAATAESARNNLAAEAAAKGYSLQVGSTLAAVGSLTVAGQGLADVTRQAADGQGSFTAAARDAGLAIGRAADGSLVLGRTQEQVSTAVAEVNRQIGLSKTSIEGAANPAKALEGAFTKTGEAAPRVVQGARDFAAYLSGAKGSGQQIQGLSLDSKFKSVAGSMGLAARDAQAFYSWLAKAAGLPQARWSGGPVEAGSEYRINELGQEAFWSAGRLSLIDAAPNSMWRAPSSGVVIPAGITSRIQQTAAVAVGGGGSPAGVAELAIEVGKLRQEVAGLAQKDWGVHVQMRTGPTASQLMNQIHRLR